MENRVLGGGGVVIIFLFFILGQVFWESHFIFIFLRGSFHFPPMEFILSHL
jgi:hypothetical protein